MDQYIVVETIHEAEFRIAMLSSRYISETIMYMCLADIYYLGEIEENSPMTARQNRFTSFQLAQKAIEELKKPRINEEKEINELCQEDRGMGILEGYGECEEDR